MIKINPKHALNPFAYAPAAYYLLSIEKLHLNEIYSQLLYDFH